MIGQPTGLRRILSTPISELLQSSFSFTASHTQTLTPRASMTSSMSATRPLGEGAMRPQDLDSFICDCYEKMALGWISAGRVDMIRMCVDDGLKVKIVYFHFGRASLCELFAFTIVCIYDCFCPPPLFLPLYYIYCFTTIVSPKDENISYKNRNL